MFRLHDERAQGIIEFAIIASLLMFLLLGTVDFARFLYYDTAVNNAARIGAESASNHCVSRANCRTTTPTNDSLVLWSTYCEAENEVVIKPTYSTCNPGSASAWDPNSACVSTCTNCTADICISPVQGSRPKNTQVSVSVGYQFHPFTFVMNRFFQEQSCYTGDTVSTNHHTLCSTSVGRVS